MAASVRDGDARGQNEGPRTPGLEPSALVIGAVVFYGLMALAGWLALEWSDLDPISVIFGTHADEGRQAPWGWPASVLLGAGSAMGIVLVTRFTRNLKPMRHMKREFAAVLGPLGTGAITVLALTSAIGEEILFRGALQPLIGFWPTVIIFGLLHGGGAPKLWLWTVFALSAGLLLGWMADETGHLLAPILCHFTVNFWNLHAIVAKEPEDIHPLDDDVRGPDDDGGPGDEGGRGPDDEGFRGRDDARRDRGEDEGR